MASLRLAVVENHSDASRPGPISVPPVPPVPVPTPASLPKVRLPDMMSESTAWSVTDAGRRDTSADRWEKFESEFGITEKEPSLVLGTMQTAKYNIDTLLFTVDDFTRNLSDSLQFEYDGGRFHHVAGLGERHRRDSSDLPMDIAKNTRLGLDLNVGGGQPYVGVKLVLPLGN